MRRMRAGRRIVAAAALVCAGSAAGAAQPCRYPGEEAQALHALSGDTIGLSDGRQVRLAGIVAPGNELAYAPRSLADAARAALDALVAGRRIVLALVAPADRHGRILAHVAAPGSADPLSVEAAMLAAGHARVLPGADGCSTSLNAVEQGARLQLLGLWSDPRYRVAEARHGAGFVGRTAELVLAEGRVASVNVAGSRLYLNFADRWRDGLSVTIWKGHFATFAGGEAGLRALNGSQVRVRGWLAADAPALMAVSDPAQLERLAPEPAAAGQAGAAQADEAE